MVLLFFTPIVTCIEGRTLPEHLNSPWFNRVRVIPALVFNVVLCFLCLSFVSFSCPLSCLSSDFFCLPHWHFRIYFSKKKKKKKKKRNCIKIFWLMKTTNATFRFHNLTHTIFLRFSLTRIF